MELPNDELGARGRKGASRGSAGEGVVAGQALWTIIEAGEIRR